MRLYEFADAEAQLGLLRTIIDNTWTAIAQQAEQERRAEAERKAHAKLKPRSRKAVKAPYASPPPPPKKPLPPQAKTEVGKQPTQQMGGGMKQPQASADNPQQPNALPTQQKAVGIAQQQPTATNPQAAQLQQPHATQLPLTPQQMRLQRQNVGYLAKNSAVTKRM